jgi:hypothetical protein
MGQLPRLQKSAAQLAKTLRGLLSCLVDRTSLTLDMMLECSSCRIEGFGGVSALRSIASLAANVAPLGALWGAMKLVLSPRALIGPGRGFA